VHELRQYQRMQLVHSVCHSEPARSGGEEPAVEL